MGGRHEISPYVAYNFEAANAHFVKEFKNHDLVAGARSRTGIITCSDARCIPERFFELDFNEAFVIRNGGGRVASEDVIRTLTLIQAVSEVKELKIVHHTDCGGLVFDDQWVRRTIAANNPLAPGGPWKPGSLTWAESMAFQSFSTRYTPDSNENLPETQLERIERSVRQDVDYLQSHPLIKASVSIRGYVYDLHTGKVEEVL